MRTDLKSFILQVFFSLQLHNMPARTKTKHQVYQCWAENCNQTFRGAGPRAMHYKKRHAVEGQIKHEKKPKIGLVTCKLCFKRINKRNISKHIAGSCVNEKVPIRKDTENFYCPLRICRISFTEKEKLDEHIKKAHLMSSTFRRIAKTSANEEKISNEWTNIGECPSRHFVKEEFCIKVEVPDEQPITDKFEAEMTSYEKVHKFLAKPRNFFNNNNSNEQVAVKEEFVLKIEVPDEMTNINGFEGQEFSSDMLAVKKEFFKNRRQKMAVPIAPKFYCHIKVCHALFDTEDDLLAHAKRVHKFLPKRRHFDQRNCNVEKGFSCNILDCGLVFETGRKLKNHMKKIHPDYESSQLQENLAPKIEV